MIRLFRFGLIAALGLHSFMIGRYWKEWHAAYQLFLPIAFASATWSKGHRFLTAAITMTLSVGFFYVAGYASDAIAMQLPPVGFGDLTNHDWSYLPTEKGILQHTQFIARLFVALGYLSIVEGFVLAGIGFLHESRREAA